MVDFQSRDTSRGFGSDDDEDDQEAEAATEEPDDATADASAESGQEPVDGAEQTAPVEESQPATAGSQATADSDRVEARTDDGHVTASEPAREQQSTAYALVTVTDDRSLSDDDQGDAAVEAVEAGGDRVVTRDLVQSGYDTVQSTVATLAERGDVDVVVTVGGTGVEPDDVTPGALTPLFEKQLPGFGELFRLLAHETEGTAVVGTRATAGIVDETPVFALPGTTAGVRLGMDRIVAQEAPRLAADAATDDA